MGSSRLAVALLCLTCAAPALAQPTRETRRRAAAARELYDAGKKAYNLGDFEKAIETWKEGYEFKDDPIFLFNIAQAYRQKADYQKAIFFYKAYTREDPRARNRAEVDARIAEMQRLLEAQQAASDAPPRGPITPEPEPARPEPPPVPEAAPPPVAAAPVRDDEAAPPHPGRGMKIAGAVAGGAGVAVAAVGVVFLLRASSIEGDLEAAARAGTPWTKDLVDKESQGRTSETLGWIGVGVGAAAAVTGATLYYLGARRDAHARRDAEARVMPVVVPGGGAVAVSWTF